MRSTRLAILSCLALAGPGAATAVVGAEVTALKILEKVFDPETRSLSYELWNDSDRTITAWRLSLARSDSLGHGQSSILDQDFFERRPAVELGSRLGPLAAGASLVAEWRLDLEIAETGPQALSLEVKSVIFDDLTWQGDTDGAVAILTARSARVEEIGKVLEILERQEDRPWSSHSWPTELRQQSQLLARHANDPEAVVSHRNEVAAVLTATRLELSRWLEDASREISLSPDPRATLGSLTSALRQRYDAGLRATLGEDAASAVSESQRGGGR